ncbi:hypothetical protein BZM27_16180 [Paraburkholderia steynii]|uniref:NodB homology domain-containing protein n=1 Tax=Paraburkholderia steynii TaxID=1245441 RepID=A0A4R0XN51_9BURK|nr:hypothetical protein BZM27_16180 [Paraburkholderia steynii]
MRKMECEAWLPPGKRVSVSVTLDNFGEACDITVGRWPANAPIGQHYTAVKVLPRLLSELDGVPLTYFVEAVNAERYPAQLRDLNDAGHEVALHSWGHEHWGRLTLDERRANLASSLAALRSIGIKVHGFRPPGGELDLASFTLLRNNGFTYCSPVSGDLRVRAEDGLTVVPFAWRHVDAYLIDRDLAAFRVSKGDADAPATAEQWAAVLHEAFDEALRDGRHLTVIFHPYLLGADDALWSVFAEFVRRLKARGDVWLASCKDIAERRARLGIARPPA